MNAVSTLHDEVTRLAAAPSTDTVVVLPLAVARQLVEHITEMCDEHDTCDSCDTALCPESSCGIGDFGCDHGHVVCSDCAPSYCRDCGIEAKADLR
ncbi:hypothetical protein [Nocardioides massiliensis]|uniref:RING-type domain-containing protein n=1 Tax=Nocardioides massiliensis TaxID=1325935 RepID=A0ABT9NJM2_9ACTN|nr:hypothetical protein [Nocardioides massiliensis]MDP9820424.1 hypothetical protein [Nocardioides massiliensis]